MEQTFRRSVTTVRWSSTVGCEWFRATRERSPHIGMCRRWTASLCLDNEQGITNQSLIQHVLIDRPVALTSERASLVLWLIPKNVMNEAIGALKANASKCLLILLLSRPSCIKKVTKPNAAGALCNIMAKKTIISTSVCDVVAAAPNAMPSAKGMSN